MALCVPKDDDETVVVGNHWVGAGEVIQCPAGYVHYLCRKSEFNYEACIWAFDKGICRHYLIWNNIPSLS